MRQQHERQPVIQLPAGIRRVCRLQDRVALDACARRCRETRATIAADASALEQQRADNQYVAA